MQISKGFSLAVLFLATLSQASAQKPQRDPAALATISKALIAEGIQPGANLIASIQYSGTVVPATDATEPQGSFTNTVKVSPESFEVRNEFQAEDHRSVFSTGHGSPFIALGDSATTLSGHMSIAASPTQIPNLVLDYLFSNPRYSVTVVDSSPTDGSLIHIHVVDDTDIITSSVTPQDWYFDSTTNLPSRVEYRIPYSQDATRYSIGSREFFSYKMQAGFLVPLQSTESIDGDLVSVATIATIQINIPVLDSFFDSPKGTN